MTEAESRIQARKQKLSQAAKILKRYVRGLEISKGALLRIAMEEDCVHELAVLTNDVLEWLDDEDYFDELAWELEGKPVV
jgi:hypothetical protein